MIVRLIFTIVVFAFIPRCNAQTQQTEKFTYTFSNEPLVKVLKTLKAETNYRLAYKVSDLKGVSVSAVFISASVEEVMDEVLPKRLGYNIMDELIIIYQVQEFVDEKLPPSRFNFSLSGEVVDFFTGEALPYASLTIKSKSVIYQSNQAGEFRIEVYPSDTAAMVVSYIGYRNLTIKPIQLKDFKEGLPIVLMLKPETTIINGAVVESYESTPILSRKEAGLKFVNVLQNAQVTNVGEADALTLVKFLPGFDPSSENNLGLGTRGMRADENLYYLDGYAIFNPDHFFGLFSSLNSLSIKNIRVLKSAYSSEYGGRSSALFDITSYSGNNKKLSTTVKSGFLSTSARIDGPLFNKKLNFSLSGRTSYTGLFSNGLYEDLFNSVYNSRVSLSSNGELNAFESSVTPELSFSDVQFKLGFKPAEDAAVSVSGFYGEDYSKYQITDNDQNSDLEIDYLNEFAWQNFGGSVTFSHKLSEKVKGKYVAAYSNFISQSNSLETISFSDINSLNRRLQSGNENGVRDLSLKSKWEYALSDSLQLDGGFEINDYRSKLNLSSFGIPITDELLDKRLYSLFGGLNQARANSSFYVGIRAIYDQTLNELALEPRLKFSQDIGEKTSVKGSYGRHNQFLRRLESLNFFRGSLDAWRLSGETSVPRSVTDHLVAGFHFEDKTLILDAEGFMTWQRGAFEDLSMVLSLGNQNASEFVFGDAQTLGLELTGQKNVKRNNFSLSYTLTESSAEYESSDGMRFVFENGRIPRHNLTGLWLWENESLSFSVTSILTSGKPYTPAVGSYVLEMANESFRPFLLFGDFNSATLPDYFRTDVSAAWKAPVLKAMDLEISGSVQNIFDRNNLNFINYSVSGNDNSENFLIFTRNVEHLGRVFSVYVTLKF